MASAGTRWSKFKSRTRNGLAAVGFVTVGGAILSVAASRRRLTAGLPEEGFVLELDLERHGVAEHVGSGALGALLDPSGRSRLQLSAVTEALRAAGGDARVKGLLGLLSSADGGMGFAQTQELREAVVEFRRRAGPRAVTLAYADAFGEGGSGGTGTYLLASAFEFVTMQPTGMLSATGLAATHPFARGFLERWKVTPHFFQREEYKSAASFLTNRTFTRPEREALQSVLSSLSAQLVAAVAAGRGLPAAQVRAAIDAAPHSSQDALRLGLVDAALYRDQAVKLLGRLQEARQPAPEKADVTQRVDGKSGAAGAAAAPPASLPLGLLPRLLAQPDAAPARPLKHVSVARYAATLAEQRRQREAAEWREQLLFQARALVAKAFGLGSSPSVDPTQHVNGVEDQISTAAEAAAGEAGTGASPAGHVALLTLSGPILVGPGSGSALPTNPMARGANSSEIASLPVIKSLRAARRDPAVKAVVLRVDSPGGSAVASDAIHREVVLLRQAGKPVVVSMGNAAASGGYYISAGASKIVAQPGTVTGSIGVLAGKLVLDEALRQYGIAMETVKTARNADAMSPFRGFDRDQLRKMNALIDDVYSHFKQVVADSRGMSAAEVAKLAKGRVWTGEQAHQLGLVDELGGLDAALALAKKEAGLPEEEGAVLVKQVFPESKAPLALLAKALRGRSSDDGNGDNGGSQTQPGSGGAASPAAWAAGLAAAALGRPLTAAEWAVVSQQRGSVVAPQCISLDAERLAGSV